jgi:hypothetical protein
MDGSNMYKWVEFFSIKEEMVHAWHWLKFHWCVVWAWCHFARQENSWYAGKSWHSLVSA